MPFKPAETGFRSVQHTVISSVVAAGLLFGISTSCFADDGVPRFEADIQPLLIRYCYECHGALLQKSGVDLRSVRLMTVPREFVSPVVIRKKPHASRLIEVLELGSMPPGGRLTDDQIETIRSWIAADCPADSFTAVYGSTFFQSWGDILFALSLMNLIAAGFLWRGALPAGPLLVVLAGFPVIALKASTWFWYPPDRYGVGVAAILFAGVAVGGSLIAAANRKNLCTGAVWGLLSPIGLFVLARESDSDSSARTADNDAQHSSETT